MKKNYSEFIYAALICLLIVTIDMKVLSQEKPKKDKPAIDLKNGPMQVKIGDIAEIKVPQGYCFADGENTRKLLEMMGNPPSNNELGYLAPLSHEWFIVFIFSETGYIKDDEKDKLDADQILNALKEGNKQGNKWRMEQNLPVLNLIGWHTKPYYDNKTNNMEWGTLAESEGHKILNYNIRYLGRKGVMEIILVDNPEKFAGTIVKAKTLLKEYSFNTGNKYGEFRPGDKIAEYGLTALVTGGAVAAAAKSGLLQKFWKIIVVGFLAVAAAAKRFIGKILGKNEQSRVASQNQENTNREM